jgi:hypothetical protein
MEILSDIWGFIFLVLIIPLVYLIGYCCVYFYISIPVILFLNYLCYLFLKKRNNFSVRKQIAFNLLLIISVPFLEFVIGWGLPIRMIIPDGYTGKIEIIEDADQGQSIPVVDFAHQVVIPQSGVLRVKSIKPWELTHTEKAFYASGKPVPTGSDFTPSPKTPSLYGGGCGIIKVYEGRKVNITYIDYTLGSEYNNEPDMKKLIN